MLGYGDVLGQHVKVKKNLNIRRTRGMTYISIINMHSWAERVEMTKYHKYQRPFLREPFKCKVERPSKGILKVLYFN